MDKKDKELIDKYYHLLAELSADEVFQYMGARLITYGHPECGNTYIEVAIPSILKRGQCEVLFDLADKYSCKLIILNSNFQFEEYNKNDGGS